MKFVAKDCIVGEIKTSAGEGPEQPDWIALALSGGLDQMTSRGQLQHALCNGSETAVPEVQEPVSDTGSSL